VLWLRERKQNGVGVDLHVKFELWFIGDLEITYSVFAVWAALK